MTGMDTCCHDNSQAHALLETWSAVTIYDMPVVVTFKVIYTTAALSVWEFISPSPRAWADKPYSQHPMVQHV